MSVLSVPRATERVTTWVRTDARFDVPASLVVFLVAVPLSLGIAVASGAPVAAGLIAAVVGGVVAGLLGGAPLQVSGPAAGLVVVVAETIAQLGWALTCVVTVLAGLVQLALGLSRVGRYALAISPTVVRAMLAGIGVSILLGQLHVSLGRSSSPTAWENISTLPASIANLQWQAATCAAVVLAVLLLWPSLPKAVRVVPAPLVAVTGVTLLAAAYLPDAERVDLGGSVLDQVGLPPLGEQDLPVLAVVGAVITVALIASIESLLSAVAVDKLHDGPRANLDSELLGQGAANSVSGLLGGLPVTGVIVRSATNVSVGARTRVSAILHGVWVALFSLVLVALVEQIPLAALAGLLVFMGINLVKPSDMAQARKAGELWIYGLTITMVLALNLVEGVMIGLAAALVVVLVRIVRASVTTRHAGTALDGRELWIVEVRGTLSFLATPRLVAALAQVPDGQVVEIDLLVDYLDPASEEQLQLWSDRYVAAGGHVDVDRPGEEVAAERGAARSEPATMRPWLPWAMWQADASSALHGDPTREDPARRARRRLASGIREFHRRTLETLRPELRTLAGGQEPDAFFLTCADSRVVPNLLTSSGPGDLFTVRTMGNVVPSGDDVSVSAALQYAVEVLDVPSVVVCGHSGCGAMTAALGAPRTDDVGRWLEHAAPVLQAWRDGHPVGVSARRRGESEADQLAQVNVALAVDALRRQAESLGRRPELVGLFFRVEEGTLWMLRDDTFVPLTDAETSELVGAIDERRVHAD